MRSCFFVEEQKLVYSANHHGCSDLNDIDATREKIQHDLKNGGNLTSPITELVVTFASEGHGAHEARCLARALKSLLPLQKLGFVFSAIVDDLSDYPYRCVPTVMTDHCEWFSRFQKVENNIRDLELDRKFLCLNRRPSAIRERLVFFLEKSLSVSSARISLGTQSNHYQGPRTWVDGARWIDGLADQDRSHDLSDIRFQSCLINVVSESSDQSDDTVWSSKFITEKTWKAYGMYQIPIWMAVPGLVSCVKSMGFDMFDDICEHHDYDTIQDEHQRQDRLIEIVARIDEIYSISDLGQLRQEIWPRLEQNRRLLEKITATSGRLWSQALREIW